MVIYGWRSSHIKSQQLKNCKCPNCETKDSITSSFFGKYFHIFWIPTFSLGKKSAAQCIQCNHVFKPKEMPDDIKRAYNEIKQDSKIPIWHFSGLIFIALLIAFLSYSSNVEAQNEQEYINNPLTGDVYEYEDGPENYSTIKVIEVTEDSIVFVQNNYGFTTKSGLHEIENDTCYGDDIYILSRTELKNMYVENIIFDINRD
ncbi:zinc-ribbon domain-containing protein [Labilibacter marinus]|uniref:zinc-ribbon domain-containing protein n=1 Tax=Labilibacter marinus TaxID=1477105 RepID=UPI00083727F7|nr:zinc-ribbon domain-containing protein [Labilibacter marinus]